MEYFKAPTTIIEDKIFYFGEKEHTAEFMKNCTAIAKFTTVTVYQLSYAVHGDTFSLLSTIKLNGPLWPALTVI